MVIIAVNWVGHRMSAVAVQIVRRVSTVFVGHLLLAVKNSKDDLFVIAALAGLTSFAFDFLSQVSPWFLSAAFAFSVGGTFVVILMPDWEDVEPAKVAHTVVFLSMTSILCAVALAAKESGYDPVATLKTEIIGLRNDTDKHFQTAEAHFAAMNSKLELIRRALAPSVQRQIQVASLTTDVSVSILVALHVIVDQRASTLDSAQQNGLFLQKANEYARLERSLTEFKPADPKAQAIVQQAREALTHGDFPTALEGMRQAGELERSSSMALETLAHNRALTAARALESSAAIGRVTMRYDEAANDLSNAAKLAAEYDPRYARQLTTAKADTLLQQGNEVGDQGAISQAAEIYRSVLATAGDSGAEVTSAQSGLDQALTKLGGRSEGTGMQGGLSSENAALRQREQMPPLGATRTMPARQTPSAREVRADVPRSQTQLQPNTPLQSARSLQRRRTQTFMAADGRVRRAPSASAAAITTVPNRATEASSQRGSSESDDQPGFFGRLRHWATGSSSSPASSPSAAVGETRPASGAAQLFRPSSIDEQRSLVSGVSGQTTRQSNTGSARHRKHSTN